jgi:hypothetical protein
MMYAVVGPKFISIGIERTMDSLFECTGFDMLITMDPSLSCLSIACSEGRVRGRKGEGKVKVRGRRGEGGGLGVRGASPVRVNRSWSMKVQVTQTTVACEMKSSDNGSWGG